MMINGSHNVCILFIPQHCVQCKEAETFVIIVIARVLASNGTCNSTGDSSSNSCSNRISPTSFPFTIVISRMRSVRILTMLVPLVYIVILLMVPLLVVLAMLTIVLLLILLMMLIITFIVHRRLKGWFFKNNIFVGCVSYRAYTGRSRRFRGPAGPVRVPHQRQSRQPKLYPQSLCDVENFRELLHSI